MKVTHTLLPDFSQSKKPFLVKKIVRPNFATDFHFHTECQLVYILSGSGTRVIGESIEHFEEGDLTFVGQNVPHVWYSKLLPDSTNNAVSVTIYINPEIVIENLKGMTNTVELQAFFKESERGINISGDNKKRIIGIIINMLEQSDLPLLSSFIQIMDILLDSSDQRWLNIPNLLSVYAEKIPGRVHKLMHYIQQNFKEEITLQQVASISGLQLHSFCRFFKALTHRTFSDFLNEVRIGFAKKLLQQSDLPITQIALECGYSNISYFNRNFRKINNITPKEYRNASKSLG